MGKRILVLIFMLLAVVPSFAQGELEMADKMRENGMIYVVVAVICLVFLGLFAYLIWQDKQLRKLEKEVFSNEN